MAARIVREACDRTRSNHLLRKGQGTRHSSHCRFEMLLRNFCSNSCSSSEKLHPLVGGSR
ncbi:hypothetical protein [Limnospira platensis]|uniref:hypothetical protein n=1 Tax=Limnospira platensis TaxID=118562 RepID=UPI001923A107